MISMHNTTHGTYRGLKYMYVNYRDLMWKNDNENVSGTLDIREFPCEHSELVKMIFERDFKGRKADNSKWLKGFIWIQEYYDDEKDLWLCDLLIPINDMLISIEEVIDKIIDLVEEVSH